MFAEVEAREQGDAVGVFVDDDRKFLANKGRTIVDAMTMKDSDTASLEYRNRHSSSFVLMLMPCDIGT